HYAAQILKPTEHNVLTQTKCLNNDAKITRPTTKTSIMTTLKRRNHTNGILTPK
ncbi:21936_t:CDS:1, partial [Gigaspora margarita]